MQLGSREHALCLVYLRPPGNRTHGRINWGDGCLSQEILVSEKSHCSPHTSMRPEMAKLFIHERLILLWKFSDYWIICSYGLRTPGWSRVGLRGKAGNKGACFLVYGDQDQLVLGDQDQDPLSSWLFYWVMLLLHIHWAIP